MRYELIIDKEQEESIVIVAHEKNELVKEIEELIKRNEFELIGYKENEMVPLKLTDIYCFYTSDGRVYAMVKNNEYLIKYRLYQVEEVANESFVKLNQGCLVNISKIKKFTASISGSIMVELKNGFKEHISRRELQNVKRRLGL